MRSSCTPNRINLRCYNPLKEVALTIEDLEQKLSHWPRIELDTLREAFNFALKAHGGQRRESGEPYINHPLQVASILAELEADRPTIVSALLHDVVEDTPQTLDSLRASFGDEIAALVDGLTKISTLSYASKEERQVENLRKIFLAMARDVRVVLIKLADRLHNLRTLNYLTTQKQEEIARETLEIYAPLASRLGVYKLKWELEDLSFRYLNPDIYFDLAKRMQRKRSERERILREVSETLQLELKRQKINPEIQYRAKHLYSIHQKMQNDWVPFEEIYDLLALRVIVKDIPSCYEVLGVAHSLFRPIPGRLKDYIAMPKPNLYQSLHTVVIGPEGEPVEIQIRTQEMHKTAELGIAAHWRYKEGGKRDPQMEKKLVWLREVLEWQRELVDSHEFLERVKVDLFADEVLVFTPKGEVVDLPVGATPVDFAYHIHTEVGTHCAGSKVNGRIVPLSYHLQTGDRVEIITKQSTSPSRDWLQFVRTSSAKGKIKAFFRQKNREENISEGKGIFDRSLRKQFAEAEELVSIIKSLNLESEEELFLALGQGQVTPQQILTNLQRLRQEKEQEGLPIVTTRHRESEPQVMGTEGLLVRIAGCCAPLPGDPIVGYITQGRGISIHRSDCRNLLTFPEKERRVALSWPKEKTGGFYPAQLFLRAANRPGVLKDITFAIAEEEINIQEINAYPLPSELTGIDLTVQVQDLSQLRQLMNKLEGIPSVNRVRRK